MITSPPDPSHGRWLALACTGWLCACAVEDPAPASIEAKPLVRFEEYEHPEGMGMASDGTLYVGILNTGEIKAIEPDGRMRSFGEVDIGIGFMPGLSVSRDDRIFVAVWQPPDGHGILEVDPNGQASWFARFPEDSFPNHITFDTAGDMYVSESRPGSLYRVDGETGAVTLWSDHPRLRGEPVPTLDGLELGANGSALSADGATLYVSNSSTHEILSIAIEADGQAGALRCFAGAADDCEIDTGSAMQGPDGLAFDIDERLYVASGLNDAILRIDVDGTVQTLWSGEPFEWPTVIVFGITPETETTLYTTNIDISRLFGEDGTPRSGVALLALDIEGLL